jgi:hypothetical protein
MKLVIVRKGKEEAEENLACCRGFVFPGISYDE